MNKYLLIIIVASLALLTQANAELYQYIDENGNVVITDNAGNIPENQRSKVKTLKEQSAYSGNPAPYTAEAAKKLEDAANQQRGHNTMIIIQMIKENAPSEEKQKFTIEAMRSIYKAAGYSYDDTIVQVAKDIQNKPELIKAKSNISPIIGQVIMGVNIMMSECKLTKVDCLKFFSTDTAAAIMVISDKYPPTYYPPTTEKAEKSNIQENRPRKMNPPPLPPPPESSQEKQ